MSIQFKEGAPKAEDLLQQAVAIGLEVNDQTKFLQFCEGVYRHGAIFGFDSAVQSILLSGKVTVKQKPLTDYQIRTHLWEQNSDLGWGNLTEIVAEIENLHGIRETEPQVGH